jgi:hypothetical protein
VENNIHLARCRDLRDSTTHLTGAYDTECAYLHDPLL